MNGEANIEEPRPIEKLYNHLVDNKLLGNDNPTLEGFELSMQDAAKQKELYDFVHQRGDFNQTFDDFQQHYMTGVGKKKVEPSAGSAGSSLESVPVPSAEQLSEKPISLDDKPWWEQGLQMVSDFVMPVAAMERQLEEANYRAMQDTFPGEPLRKEYTDNGTPVYVTQSQKETLDLQRGQEVLTLDMAKDPYTIANDYTVKTSQINLAKTVYQAELKGIRDKVDKDLMQKYEDISSRIDVYQKQMDAGGMPAGQEGKVRDLIASLEGERQSMLADPNLMEFVNAMEFRYTGAGGNVWNEYDRGAHINRQFERMMGNLQSATQALATQLGEDNLRSYFETVAFLEQATPDAEGYQQAVELYQKFQQDPRFEQYAAYAQKAQTLASKWEDAASQYPTYYQEAEEIMRRQQRVDMLARETLWDTIKGVSKGERTFKDLSVQLDPWSGGELLPRSALIPIRQEALKFINGVITYPIHAVDNLTNLPGLASADLAGTYSYGDAIINRINRFLSPEKSMYFMTESKSQRPIMEDVVEVDGFEISVEDDGTPSAVYDSGGYRVSNETASAVVSKYQSNPGRYERRRKINYYAALGIVSSGSAQLAIAAVGGAAGEAAGLGANIGAIGSQAMLQTNEIYRSAIRELGPENADVASAYAMGAGLALSTIGIAVGPLETRLAKAFKPANAFKADIPRLKRLLEAGIDPRKAIATVSKGAYQKAKVAARGALRWAQNVGGEGAEGVVEQLADAGLRSVANMVADPASGGKLTDVDLTIDGLFNAFAEEALGALIGASAEVRVGNEGPLYSEGLYWAFNSPERQSLLQGLTPEAQAVYSRVFAAAETHFAENPKMTDKQKETWLTAEVGKERAAVQGKAGTLDPGAVSGEKEKATEVQKGVTEGTETGIKPLVPGTPEVPPGLSEVETMRLQALRAKPGQAMELPGLGSYTITEIKNGEVSIEWEDGSTDTYTLPEYIKTVNGVFDGFIDTHFPDTPPELRVLAKKMAAIMPAKKIIDGKATEQKQEAAERGDGEEGGTVSTESGTQEGVDGGEAEGIRVRGKEEGRVETPTGETETPVAETPEVVPKVTRTLEIFNDPFENPQGQELPVYTANNVDDLVAAAKTDKDKKVAGMVASVVKAMSRTSPIGVVLHTTKKSFYESHQMLGGPGQRRGYFTRGFALPDDGTLHINLKELGKDMSTIYHEAAHILMRQAVRANPNFRNQAFDQLKKIPAFQKSGILEDRSQNYPKDRLAEECIVEFIAQIGTGGVRLNDDSTFSKVKGWINQFLEAIGLADYVVLDTRGDVVEFCVKAAEALKTGKEIQVKGEGNLSVPYTGEGIAFDQVAQAEEPSMWSSIAVRPAAPNHTDITFIGASRMIREDYETYRAAGLRDPFLDAVATHFGLDRADVDSMAQAETRIGRMTERVNPFVSLARLTGSDRLINGVDRMVTQWNRLFNYAGAAPRELAALREAMKANIDAETEIAIAMARRAQKLIDGYGNQIDMGEVDAIIRGYETDYDNFSIPKGQPGSREEAQAEELWNILVAMRRHIDDNSRELIRNGFITGQRLDAVLNNYGYYTNRSYRLFMDPGWNPDAQTVEAAVLYWYDRIYDSYQRQYPHWTPQQLADHVRRIAENDIHNFLSTSKEKGGEGAGEGKLQQGIFKRKRELPPQANAVLYKVRRGLPVPDDLMRDMEAAIRREREQHRRENPAQYQGVNIDQLIQDDMQTVLNDDLDQNPPPWMDVLAPEMRALMGEYEHPLEAYNVTIMKVSNYAETARFLGGIQAMGMGRFMWSRENAPRQEEVQTVPLFKKTAASTEPATRIWRDPMTGIDQLAFSSPDAMSMFMRDDIVTTPEVKEFLVGIENVANGDSIVKVHQYLSGLLGAQDTPWRRFSTTTNWMYTVASLNTQVKNFFGNLPMMVGNGMMNPFKLAQIRQTGKVAYYEVFNKRDYAVELMKGDQSEIVALTEKLKRAGILNQEPSIQAIKHMLSTTGEDLFRTWSTYYTQRPQGMVQHMDKWRVTAKKKLEDLYQAHDNFFKVTTYISECDRMADALFDSHYVDLSDAERAVVDQYAIEIVKNTLPNYSRIGALGQVFSQSWFLGSFLSFKLESIRVSFNQATLTYRQLTSSNAKIRRIGALRALGLGIAHGGRYGVLYGLNALVKGAWSGDDDEEDRSNVTMKDIRRFVPPWVKYSDIILYKLKDGYVEYGDVTTIDPYGMAHVFMKAITTEGAYGAAEGFFTDFMDQTVFFSAVNEAILKGETSYGDPIADPNDSTLTEVGKRAAYLADKTFKPATWRAIQRAIKQDAGPLQTALYFAPGITNYRVDINKGFYFNMRDYYDKQRLKESPMNDIRKRLYKVMSSDMSEEDKIVEAEKIEAMRKGMLDEIREDYQAAIRLGADAKQLADTVDQMTSSQYFKQGKLDAKYIKTGKYTPLPINKFR